MTEQAEDLILSILKDVQGRLGRLDTKVDDLREQFHTLSADHIAIKKDGVRQDESIAHLHLRQDRMEAALARIHTRLGLIEPDA